MQYLQDTGFVIKRINIGEADRFLTIFTQHHGRIEVVAKGVRKTTSKRSSHIELFNLVRFNAIKTSKNYILTEVTVVDTFDERKQDLTMITKIFFMCELIEKLCVEGQIHSEIYNLLLSAVVSDEKNLFDFQVQLLTILGFWNREKEFQTEDDLKVFIEEIVERKIKSQVFFTKI